MLKRWEPLTLFLRQPGAPAGQQYLRESAEDLHPPPQQLAVLQNRERCPCRRPVHELHPHLPTGPRQPLRLSRHATAAHPPCSATIPPPGCPGTTRLPPRRWPESDPVAAPPASRRKTPATHAYRRDTDVLDRLVHTRLKLVVAGIEVLVLLVKVRKIVGLSPRVSTGLPQRSLEEQFKALFKRSVAL